jgi:hypothetical protein
MLHTLGGEPFVGNAAFTLDLANAPGGTFAFAFLNIGACGPPVFSPPLCAGIRVPLSPPPVGFPSGTGGTPGLCNGAVNLNLPIPNNWALCGLPLCSQFVGLCGSSIDYVSNAVSWTIVGS